MENDSNCEVINLYHELARNKDGVDFLGSSINSENVIINVKNHSHISGSSCVTSRTITRFACDAEKLSGNIVAHHCTGLYIAYSLKNPNSPLNDFIRVLHKKKEDSRELIRPSKCGIISDLSFAHMTNRILLGFIDKFGAFYVYEIFDHDALLSSVLLLQANSDAISPERTSLWSQSDYQRFVWCKFIPDSDIEQDDEEDNFAFIFAVTNGSVAELWHLALILQSIDDPKLNGKHELGYQIINEHEAPITDASFSPDGTAFATAASDGYVKFFQIDMLDTVPPQCVHQWSPHNGDPVSSLFFLENYKHLDPEVGLWRYAVTGARNNTELKMWSCTNWKCIQTIKFACNEKLKNPLNFRAVIDSSSKYLILTDFDRKVLYVLIINKLPKNGEAEDNFSPRYISVNEIEIYPGALHITIKDANIKQYKQWKKKQNDEYHSDDEEGDIITVNGLVIEAYTMMQKSFEDTKLQFKPFMPDSIDVDVSVHNSSTEESITLTDALTDISMGMIASESVDDYIKHTTLFPAVTNGVSCEGAENEEASSKAITPPVGEALTMSLLTPDSFNTSNNKESYNNDPFSNATPEEYSIIKEMNLNSPLVDIMDDEPTEVNSEQTMNGGLRQPPTATPLFPNAPIAVESSTSSPSLEVQQILNKDDYYEHSMKLNCEEDKSTNGLTYPADNKEPFYSQQVFVNDMPKANLLLPSSMSNGSDTTSNLMNLLTEKTESSTSLASLSVPNASQSSSLSESRSNLLRSINPPDYEFRTPITCSDLESEIKTTPVTLDSSQKIVPQITLEHVTDLKERLNKLQENQEKLESMVKQFKNKFDSEWKSKSTKMSQKINENSNMLSRINNNVVDLKKESERIVRHHEEDSHKLKSSVQSLIKNEMKSGISNAMNKCTESFKGMVHNEIQNVVEQQLPQIKDELINTITSDAFQDKIISTINANLSKSVQTTTKDCYNSIVVPAFTSVTNNMLGQINNTFCRGTDEYMKFVQNKVTCVTTAANDNLIKNCQNMEACINATQNMVKAMHNQMDNTVNMETRLRRMVREEMEKCFQEQNSIQMRSRAQTPMTPMPQGSLNVKSAQQQLQTLITQQDFHGAFKQALMLSDISLVVFVCERLNPHQIFSQTPCPLGQDVLLSLINQLSYDLSTYTDLKLKYLEDAIATLDTSHHVTKEHMRPVLTDCQRALTAYSTSNPKNKKIKMLLYAVNHLLI